MVFILAILFIHFIADFVFQTHQQAINKSRSNVYLTKHVLSYTVGLYIGGLILLSLVKDLIFEHFVIWTCINGILHWITDYFTSRLNAWLWSKNEVHWFFVGVGFDQFIHYTCLLLSFELLCK